MIDTRDIFYRDSRSLDFLQLNEDDLHSGLETRSFSGADIRAYVTLPGERTFPLGTLSLLSVSSHRDKFPVTTLGRVNPKGFTHGHRVIAGTMVFQSFDRSVWHGFMERATDGAPFDLEYEDNLPPFNVSISFVNEFGTTSMTGVRGVTLLDASATYSIDDPQVKEVYSYMAIDRTPFQPFTRVHKPAAQKYPVPDHGLAPTISVVTPTCPSGYVWDESIQSCIPDGTSTGGGSGGVEDPGWEYSQTVQVTIGLSPNRLYNVEVTCTETGVTKTSSCSPVTFKHPTSGVKHYTVAAGAANACASPPNDVNHSSGSGEGPIPNLVTVPVNLV